MIAQTHLAKSHPEAADGSVVLAPPATESPAPPRAAAGEALFFGILHALANVFMVVSGVIGGFVFAVFLGLAFGWFRIGC